MSEINDYGIKVSFPGINVKDAADYELLFNSSWPTLKITDSLRLSSAVYPGTAYTHSLGYVPLCIPFGRHASGANGIVTINRQNIAVDSQNVYTINAGGAPGFIEQLFQIYAIDIETTFTTNTVSSVSAGSISTDSNYGIKVSLPNKDISSTDLRDFTVHSSTRGPTVHAVKPGTTNGSGVFSYTHDLSYDPMFIVFYQYDVTLPHRYVVFNGYAGISASGQTITVTASASRNVSIVILKDPLDPGDNVITANV